MKMTGKRALDRIKSVGLRFSKHKVDDLIFSYEYETCDRTVGEGFPDEIEAIEKCLKALEIIKEKKVDFQLLKQSEELDDYNWWLAYQVNDGRELSQEEFDLLKEVFL